jgi:hypothetical protein
VELQGSGVERFRALFSYIYLEARFRSRLLYGLSSTIITNDALAPLSMASLSKSATLDFPRCFRQHFSGRLLDLASIFQPVLRRG